MPPFLQAPRLTFITVVLVGLCLSVQRASGIGFYDGGELAMAAAQLGLGHPPGQPLYTLLGHLMVLLLPTSAADAMVCLSVLSLSLSVVPAVAFAERSLLRVEGGKLDRRASICLHAAIAIAFQHALLWESATRVEVYALAGLLGLFGHELSRRTLEGAGWSTALAAGLCFGGAASTHPAALLVFAAATLPSFLLALRRGKVRLSSLLVGLLGGLVGLLPYAYVPLVMLREDVFVWGSDDVMRYLSAQDFAGNLAAPLDQTARHVVEWLAYAVEAGFIPMLVLGTIGCLLIEDVGPLVGFMTGLLLIARNAAFLPEVTDYLGYLHGPFVLLVAAAPAQLVRAIGNRGRFFFPSCLALVGATVCASPAPTSRTRSSDEAPEKLVELVFRQAPKDALLHVGSDHYVFPLLYAQEVLGARPDVVLLADGLLDSSWYWVHLYRRHPELVPTPMRGEGGRDGRLRRFHEANAGRPLLVEHGAYARPAGVTLCAGPMLAQTPPCPDTATLSEFTRELTSLADVADFGSPPTERVLAELGLSRGLMYAFLGVPEAAIDAVLAGVPSGSRPVPDTVLAPAIRPEVLRPPSFIRAVAIGDPAHNLFVAATWLGASGDVDAAGACLASAAELGLHEAMQ